MVETLLNVMLLLALVVWIGSIIFFSFVVAPTVFRVLSPPDAGRVVRAVFPKYYLVGIVCGVIAIGAFLIMSSSHSVWASIAVAQIVLLAVMVGINIYARQSLTPRINVARDAGDGEKARFDRLHRQSVMLNGMVLLLGLVVLLLIGQTIGTPT